jgi:hypothetical protein
MTDKGIIAYQFDLRYDSNVIQPQAVPCDLDGTISSDMTATCNSSVPGVLKIVLFGTAARSGAGVLLNLKFNAIGAIGSTSPLTLKNFIFNEGSAPNVTTKGHVQIAGPTAASVSVGGRVTVNGGKGLANARVYLTNADGSTRTAITNNFGYYNFEDVGAGATYTINVVSKRFTFAPQVVNVSEQITNLNFTAEP